MLNDLDDLFRQELDGHASEPAADLWARLQARTAAPADADPVDAQFRAGLAAHATPPRRELWERLEDEHLRPRQRRRPVVAWGRLAVAASLLLLVLAGGAGLWWNAHHPASGPVAATSSRSQGAGPRAAAAGVAATPATEAAAGVALANHPVAAVATPEATTASETERNPHTAENQYLAKQPRATSAVLLAAQTTGRKKNQKIAASQATGFGASSSSSPVARTAAPRRPATAPQPVPGPPKPTPQPDAAAGPPLALGGRKLPGSQPTTQPETPALAAAAPQIIEVDVRRGSRPAPAEAPVAVAATEAANEPRPRLRLGGLLRQAGHALRGEPVSLAEATGLPETVTVQARLGGRVVSRTIQL